MTTHAAHAQTRISDRDDIVMAMLIHVKVIIMSISLRIIVNVHVHVNVNLATATMYCNRVPIICNHVCNHIMPTMYQE